MGETNERNERVKRTSERAKEKNEKERENMEFLGLVDDNLVNIMQHLDIITIVYLLICSKQIYNMRKMLVRCIADVEGFKEYQNDPDTCKNLIAALFNSYIDLDYGTCFYISEIKNKNKLDYHKAVDTLKVVGYYCKQDNFIFEYYKSDINIVELLAKSVCNQYVYKYTKPSSNIYCLFWINWFDIDIDLFDICTILYHVKHRKYMAVLDTLNSMKYKQGNIMKTIDYMVQYINLKYSNRQLNAVLICIMYSFIEYNIVCVKEYKMFCNVAVEKAYEFHDSINERMHGMPKYLKIFILNKLKHVSNMIMM